MCIRDRRTLELESELEQDEHPRDYHAELEDEEEEAAPTSEKRLKREIRAEALKRLEEAARTERENDLILINQEKTDVPLKLPLRPVVGNAIYDYICQEPVSYTHLDVYKRQVHG